MYAHLVGQRPELASGTWSVPGYGRRTLRELLVEQGVVPAELADRYALAGAKGRPSGGRARQEAARGGAGAAPSLSETRGATPTKDPVEPRDTRRQLGLEDSTPQTQEQWEAPNSVDLQSTTGLAPRLLPKRGPIHSALLSLPKKQRVLWTKPDVLLKALQHLYRVMDPLDLKKPEAVKLVKTLDEALMAGLKALQLGRMELRDVNIGHLEKDMAGVLRASGELQIDYAYLHYAVYKQKCPGAIWKTWIHEIVHARDVQKKVLPGEVAELLHYQGYEDGFAEMFSRFVTVEQARMPILADSYNYYVQAYEMLTRAAGVDKRDLMRKLYLCQPGTIRSEFPRILGELRGRKYTPEEGAAISRVADQLFQEGNELRPADFRTAGENFARWWKVLR
jgi:hypothetical protein